MKDLTYDRGLREANEQGQQRKVEQADARTGFQRWVHTHTQRKSTYLNTTLDSDSASLCYFLPGGFHYRNWENNKEAVVL